MTPKTTSIYIAIAQVQAKRRENWIAGFPIDRGLEDRHQSELAELRKELIDKQETIQAQKPKSSKLSTIIASFINILHRKPL